MFLNYSGGPILMLHPKCITRSDISWHIINFLILRSTLALMSSSGIRNLSITNAIGETKDSHFGEKTYEYVINWSAKKIDNVHDLQLTRDILTCVG